MFEQLLHRDTVIILRLYSTTNKRYIPPLLEFSTKNFVILSVIFSKLIYFHFPIFFFLRLSAKRSLYQLTKETRRKQFSKSKDKIIHKQIWHTIDKRMYSTTLYYYTCILSDAVILSSFFFILFFLNRALANWILIYNTTLYKIMTFFHPPCYSIHYSLGLESIIR